jgi:hypothetical protein
MPGSGTGSSTQRSAVFGVAAGGVLLGHWLTYAVAGPSGNDAHAVTAHLEHGYLSLANDLALALALAGVAIVFLGRLTHSDDAAPTWRATALRLGVFQIAAFGAMETLERLSAGAPMHDLVGLMPVGIAVQAGLALLGGLLIAWLLRAAAFVESLLGAAPGITRARVAAWLALTDPPPRARLAVAADGIRGPPPAR